MTTILSLIIGAVGFAGAMVLLIAALAVVYALIMSISIKLL